MKTIQERIKHLESNPSFGKKRITNTIYSNCCGTIVWVYDKEKNIEELSKKIPIPEIYVKNVKMKIPPFVSPHLMEIFLKENFKEVQSPEMYDIVAFWKVYGDKKLINKFEITDKQPILQHTGIVTDPILKKMFN